MTAGPDTVELRDIPSGSRRRTLPGREARARSFAFNPDGTVLAVAYGDGKVRLWDAGEGKELACLEGTSACFSPDGESLARAGKGRVILTDRATGTDRVLAARLDEAFERVAFHPGGRLLVAWDSMGSPYVFDVPAAGAGR